MTERVVGNFRMLGRLYFARQAAALLQFAKTTKDPRLCAVLIEKATELKSQSDRAPVYPDVSPLATDVQKET
jgi:hypothetical protein